MAFVARRQVDRTLADEAPPGWREQLRSALAAAHAAGLVHGRLSPGTVLVEGERVLLGELRLPPGDDDDAFAADLAALDALDPPRRRRRATGVIAAVLVLGALIAAALLLRDAEEDVPGVPAGAVAAGSALAAGGAPRDCSGRAPEAGSVGCTLIGIRDGRPVTAPATGVIRSWTVRGARGDLAVQVVRRRADGNYAEAGRSQYAPVDGTRQVAADVPVRRGDLLGLELGPGAGIAREDGRVLRFAGPLDLPRPPRRPDAAPAGGAPLVRFELVPGARPRVPPSVTGAAAARLPAGRTLAVQTLEPGAGRVLTVRLVEAGGGVALDLFRDGRRRSRTPAPGLDPAGRLDVFEQGFTTADVIRVRWRNPGVRLPLLHGWTVRGDRLVMLH